jgi:pilus assembly protein Flp/PilA
MRGLIPAAHVSRPGDRNGSGDLSPGSRTTRYLKQADPNDGADSPQKEHNVINLISYVQSYFVTRFNRDERGASLVEYALLVALIAVVCIAVIGFLGTSARDKFSEVGSKIAGA